MNFGCTAITLSTEDNSHIFGRSYDFFGDLKSNNIIFFPKGDKLSFSAPETAGDEISLTYGFAGMGINGLKTPIVVDGINEKGVVGALLNFPEYGHFCKPAIDKENIHPAFFVGYILSQCSSIDDIVYKIPSICLTDELIMGSHMSVHYIFSDKTGESIVIEPIKDGIKLYRNTIGILANSPEYNWHLTNLRNYSKVDNLPSGKRKLRSIEISEFGYCQGGGFGLPGGYSSPARFVKVALMREFAPIQKDEADGLNLLFSILKSVEIPEGIIAGDKDATHFDTTLCTTAACSESLTYYFKTRKNSRISAVRLNKLINDGVARQFNLADSEDILYLN